MSLVNMMEDKIKATVNEVLSVRDDRFLLTKYMEDIVAFVLNRVPPRYITSGRGLIHNEIEFSINSQLQTDIRLCVNDAIRTLTSRREPEKNASLMSDYVGKHYYFPYVIGEVLEESTFSIIPDVEVKLFYNNSPVSMIDPSWANPYITCNATKGFYIFWPDFLKEEMDTAGDNIFRISFRHKKFFKKELSFSMRALDNINMNRSLVVPLALLKIDDETS